MLLLLLEVLQGLEVGSSLPSASRCPHRGTHSLERKGFSGEGRAISSKSSIADQGFLGPGPALASRACGVLRRAPTGSSWPGRSEGHKRSPAGVYIYVFDHPEEEGDR